MPKSKLENLINSIADDVKEELPKVKKTASKTMTKAKKEVKKASTKAKKETTKAVKKATKTVKKEAPKAIAKAKKETTKAVKKATKTVKKEAPKAVAKAKKETTKAVKKATKAVKKEAPKVAKKVKNETAKAAKTTKKAASKAVKNTKTATKKATKVAKTTAKKATKATKTTAKKITKTVKEKIDELVEYYDLPYRYNQTVVKVLAQNPNTLFVYWDVNDSDIENFKKQFGDNFYYITKPVLVIKNLTDNYTFEIDIDDFANNWYVHVNDTKCKYQVELIRRPNQSSTIHNNENNQDTHIIDISSSNTIEIPNDHVLFFNDNDTIFFKNIKTNEVTSIIIKGSGYIKDVKAIYKNYEVTENENRLDLKNPSSATSNVM